MQDTNENALMGLPPSDELPPEMEANRYKPVIADAEIAAVADELTRIYKKRLDYYTSEKQRKEYPHRTTEEHIQLSQWEISQEHAVRAMNIPADELNWGGLEDIFNYNPALFVRKWEEIKQEAGRVVQSGLIAQIACSPEGTPYEKAQFLALRNELADEWNPRNGIERNLIDQMASAYTQVLYWQKIMFRWMNLDSPIYNDRHDKPNEHTPRLSTFESVNRAADMVDRFNRMFLRTLRALQNMRRYAPVIVQNAGQVNVGQQQVNVAQAAGG